MNTTRSSKEIREEEIREEIIIGINTGKFKKQDISSYTIDPFVRPKGYPIEKFVDSLVPLVQILYHPLVSRTSRQLEQLQDKIEITRILDRYYKTKKQNNSMKKVTMHSHKLFKNESLGDERVIEHLREKEAHIDTLIREIKEPIDIELKGYDVTRRAQNAGSIILASIMHRLSCNSKMTGQAYHIILRAEDNFYDDIIEHLVEIAGENNSISIIGYEITNYNKSNRVKRAINRHFHNETPIHN